MGGVAGLVNGLIVCYARIAPLIATLATSSIIVGIALYILPYPGGSTIPGWMSSWTAGTIGSVPVSAISVTQKKAKSWLTINTTKDVVKKAVGYKFDKKSGLWNPQ